MPKAKFTRGAKLYYQDVTLLHGTRRRLEEFVHNERRGRSVPDLIRELIDEWLARQPSRLPLKQPTATHDE